MWLRKVSHSGHVLVLTASVIKNALIKLSKRKKENKKASVNRLTKETLPTGQRAQLFEGSKELLISVEIKINEKAPVKL